MLRVGTMSELFNAAETLALTRDQNGDRLGIINGGGAGVLAVDALEAAGGRLAELAPHIIDRLTRLLPPTWSRGNPVDIIGDASGQRYAAALEALCADPGVDAFLILNCPTALAAPEEAARAIIAQRRWRRPRKPPAPSSTAPPDLPARHCAAATSLRLGLASTQQPKRVPNSAPGASRHTKHRKQRFSGSCIGSAIGATGNC